MGVRSAATAMEQAEPESELVRLAATGDSVALKLLLTQSRDELCQRMARRVPADLRGVVDIEDVIQETHIRVFRGIGAFNSRDLHSFHRWIMAIALNQLRNVIKHHRAQKRGGQHLIISARPAYIEDSTLALLDTLAGPGRTPSKWVARKEAIEAVQVALAELPEHYRAALWLVYIESLSIKAAAADMGQSERSVHGLCRRGLDLLRQRLQSTTTFLNKPTPDKKA